MTRRRAFIFDQNKCIGCHACETACRIAKAVPGERRWRRVRTFNELHVHGVEVSHLSMACNHCADAPCMEACPSSAIYRDEETGAVLIDGAKCIGCRYCSWVCPYGALCFDDASGVTTKCDFCVDRQRASGDPACVTACPTGALEWGELDEVELTSGPLVHGMAETDARPSIHIVPLRAGRLAPRQAEAASIPPWEALAKRLVSQTTASGEWPLIAFTMLAAILVGIFLASRFGAPTPSAVGFALVGIIGLLVGACHLGRKARAWRAPANAGRSWLSREILLFISFLAVTSVVFAGYGGAALGWLAAALGIAALAAVDRTYGSVRVRGGGALHSARILGTGLLFAAVWGGAWVAAVLLAGIKGALYVRRKLIMHRRGLPARGPVSALRLGALAAAGVAAWWGAPQALTFGFVTLSEIVDRAEFYDELRIPTPESLMLEELGQRPEAGYVDSR